METCTAITAKDVRCRKHRVRGLELCSLHVPHAPKDPHTPRKASRSARRPPSLDSVGSITQARSWIWRALRTKKLTKEEAAIHLTCLRDQERSLRNPGEKEIEALAVALINKALKKKGDPKPEFRSSEPDGVE